MKTGLAVCVAVGVLFALSGAQRSVKDLEGSYQGPIVFPSIMAFDDDEVPGNHCLDKYSEECRAEVPNGIMTIEITSDTISLNFSQSIGVATPEVSKKTYPACVAGGLYPAETITPLPPAKIQNFDPTTGHLTFISDKRPDDTNCIILQTEEAIGSKSLSAKYIVTGTDMTEMEVFSQGPSFRCVVYNDLCVADTNTEGKFVSFADVEVKLPLKT